MAENNATAEGVTSPPVETPPQAPSQTNDAMPKGNVSGSQAAKYLAANFIKKAEADAAAKKPDDRSSSIAALSGDQTAAPEGTQSLPAETKVPAQAEPEVEAPDVPFNLTHLDSKQKELVEAELKRYKESNQKNIQERINREVGKRKALEGELAAVRGQRSPLDAPQQQAQQPQQVSQVPFPAAVPFSNISDPGALQREAQQARLFHSLADDAIVAGPSGARVDDTGKRVDLYSIEGAEYTKEQVMNIRRNAREAFQVGIPARMEDLKLRQQNRAQAEAAFPWIRDSSSPDFQKKRHEVRGCFCHRISRGRRLWRTQCRSFATCPTRKT